MLESSQVLGYFDAIQQAGRFTGAGSAAIGISGGGIGIGLVFNGFLGACARQPHRANDFFKSTLLGFALAEATGLLALMVSFLILYA